MKIKRYVKNILPVLLVYIYNSSIDLFSYIVSVGSGSYTTVLPAGKTAPPSTVYKTENLYGGVPINKWFSSLLAMQYSSAHYGLPLSFKHTQHGIQIGLPVYEEKDDNVWGYYVNDIEVQADVGGATLVSPDSRLDSFSDWFIKVKWTHFSDSSRYFKASYGHGSVFVYFEYSEGAKPKLVFPGSVVAFDENGNISGNVNKDHIGIITNGKYYGLFAPSGSTFEIYQNYIMINLPQNDRYFSLGIMTSPSDLSFYYQYAYSFVIDTKVSWNYDEKTSLVTTNFELELDKKRQFADGTIIVLFPHQWKSLKGNYDFLTQTFRTVRGYTKLIIGKKFSTINRFFGILPFMPDIGSYDKQHLQKLLNEDKLQNIYIPDSYNSAKQLARTVNLIPIAEQLKDNVSKNYLITKVKDILVNWLTYTYGEEYSFFYYDNNWGSLIPYNNSFGDDNGLTDHHFQYGYFIYTAAILSLYDKNFRNNYGPMIEILIKDIFCPYRNDNMFPFLRYKDVYMGHCWASGFAWNNDSGNNQESTSEAMNAWAAIIMWGLLTGNTTYRDLGIWGYVTEYSAIREYWFDIDNTTYGSEYKHEIVSLLFGGSGFYGTWFSGEPEYIYGIQWYPVTACHLYLGYDVNYCQKIYSCLVNEVSTLGRGFLYWKDYIWRFQSFFDPQSALSVYDETYQFDNGHTKTFLYHWLHNFNVLGRVSTEFYADYPSYAIFKNNNITKFVVYNFDNIEKTINFYKVQDSSYYGSIVVPSYSIAVSTYLIGIDISPQVSIKNLQSGTTINMPFDVLVEVKDDKGIKKLEFYLNSIEVYELSDIGVSSNVVYSLKKEYLLNKENVFKVVVYDMMDQQAYAQANFYFINNTNNQDTTLPYVKILQPQEASAINGNYYVVVVASDDYGIEKVEFYVNNLVKYIDTDFPYMFMWNTTNYLDGAYTLKVIAYDNAGNYSLDEVLVNINNFSQDNPPNISIVSPQNGSVVSGIVEIKIDAIDDVGIDRAELYLNNELFLILSSTQHICFWDTSYYQEDVYLLKVVAYDIVGQVDVATITVVLQKSQVAEDEYTYEIKNFPNPFKKGEVTAIKFKAKKQTDNIKVTIFDMSGKFIKSLKVYSVGDNKYKAIWDGTNNLGDIVALGVYICSVDIDGEKKYRKIVLAK